MAFRNIVRFAVLLCACVASTCYGDDSWACPNYSWSAFQLRQTQDGSANQNKPAQIAYQHGSAGETYLVDTGARIGKLDCTMPGGEVIVTPVFEYHRNSDPANLTNTYSGGLSAEITPSRLEPMGLKSESGSSDASLHGTLLTSAKAKQNNVAHNTSAVATLALQTYRNAVFSPFGSILRHESQLVPPTVADLKNDPEAQPKKATSLKLAYFPSLGFEYYNKLPIVQNKITLADKVDATFVAAHVYFEYWPWPHAGTGGLQTLFDGVLRARAVGDSQLSTYNRLASIQATYYFDIDQKVGLGVGYTVGDDPDRDFLHTEHIDVALKVKL